MKSIQLIFALLALVLLMDSRVATAQDVFELSYGMKKGDVLFFNENTVTTTVQERMGEEMKNTVTVRTKVKWVVEDVTADGVITIIASPEEIAIDAPGMQEGRRGGRNDSTAIKEMIGKRTKIVVTAAGRVVSQTALDPAPAGRRGSMRQASRFFALPERPVGIGDTWKSTGADTINVGFSRALAKYTLTYTVDAKEQRLGHDCLKVSYKGKQDLSGQGEMRGTTFSLEGTGTLSGVAYIDYAKGLIIEEQANNDQQAIIAMTGEREMTMPMSQSIQMKRLKIEN
jgi:hypothetical protein